MTTDVRATGPYSLSPGFLGFFGTGMMVECSSTTPEIYWRSVKIWGHRLYQLVGTGFQTGFCYTVWTWCLSSLVLHEDQANNLLHFCSRGVVAGRSEVEAGSGGSWFSWVISLSGVAGTPQDPGSQRVRRPKPKSINGVQLPSSLEGAVWCPGSPGGLVLVPPGGPLGPSEERQPGRGEVEVGRGWCSGVLVDTINIE